MPDKRKHRGQHPADIQLFQPSQMTAMQQAGRDLSWLLSREYPEKAALKLVGDRYRLKGRQRLALSRNAASRQAIELRKAKELNAADIAGREIWIDGFNLLITIESALSGGLVFKSMDGCFRDLASIHGSYKRVTETDEAILLTGKVLTALQSGAVHWLLDQPVSNSGRLKRHLGRIAEEKKWDWSVDLDHNPDRRLIESGGIVVSSDSLVIEKAKSWFNLSKYLIEQHIPSAKLVDLSHKSF